MITYVNTSGIQYIPGHGSVSLGMLAVMAWTGCRPLERMTLIVWSVTPQRLTDDSRSTQEDRQDCLQYRRQGNAALHLRPLPESL